MGNTIWLPSQKCETPRNNQVGVFVDVTEIFPGCEPTIDELKENLSKLSRTDALIWCARLNLVISNATCHDPLEKQHFAVKTMFSTAEIDRIGHFFAERTNPESTRVFFRGQLLDLMAWIAAYCHDLPEDGATFENAEVRQAFSKAALIVSHFWGKRVYGDKLTPTSQINEKIRTRALPSFRLGTESATTQMDPLFAIGRGRELFADCFDQIRNNASQEFFLASGLTWDQFYGLLTILAVHYLARVEDGATTKPSTGLFHERDFSTFTNLANVFPTYAALAAQSPDEMTAASKRNNCIDDLQLGGAAWIKGIRDRPLLRVEDGRCIVLDPAIFAEHAAVGPLFLMLKNKTKQEVNQLFTDFGNAFESYARAVLRRMYPIPQSPLINRLNCDPKGQSESGDTVQISDALLHAGRDVALFEMKAVWLTDKVAEGSNSQDYLNRLNERYSTFGENTASAKGVGQLARTISKLTSRQWSSVDVDIAAIRKIFPILLVHDAQIGTACHPWYLAEQFRHAITPDSELRGGGMIKSGIQVASPIVVSIDDLERLETSIEHFALMQLFRDYDSAIPDRLCGLHNFLTASAYSKQLYASRNLAGSALKALHIAKTLMSK